jgi:hypothetical protein
MKRLIQSLMVCALTLVTQGVVGAPVDAEVAYRYLIVLENSARMDRQQQVALDTVHQLILSGIQGRIREGDRLGIWTFRDRLERHSFQPILWSPGRARDVANDVYRTLRNSGFTREPALDLALSGVTAAAQATDLLTVFLVVSGTQSVHGTPFDADINQVFDQHAQAMRKNRRPFVVVLVMDQGRTVSHATSPGGRTIYVPPVPEVPAPAQPPPKSTTRTPPNLLPPDEDHRTPTVQADPAAAVQLSTDPRTVEPAPKPRVLTVMEIERELQKAQEERIRREAEAAALLEPPPIIQSRPDTSTDPINNSHPPQPQIETTAKPATPEPHRASLVSMEVEAPSPVAEVESFNPGVKTSVEPVSAMIAPAPGPPRWRYLLAGLGLLLVAGILSAYMYQRSLLIRARPSAISRSMDRY